MKKIKQKSVKSNEVMNRLEVIEGGLSGTTICSGRIELIQQLIPLGLEAVNDVLQQEVIDMVGERYERTTGDYCRWGSNPGSVYLGGQKVAIQVPRVRDASSGKEVQLTGYQELKDSGGFDEQIFRNVINGISTRSYEKVAEQVPETFGIRKSSVSRSFKQATAKKLRELVERDLSNDDIVAIFIDGKSLRDVQVMIGLGVTMEGVKIPLGFIETSTENAQVCKDFLNGLIDRGLNTEQEILFVVDGAKGISKAIKRVLGKKAVIQRCQWHKRENVISYLPKNLQGQFRSKLQAAYEEPDYNKAKAKLAAIRKELSLINQSAANSLDEGLEQTLTLQRLGLFHKVGKSFKTTNCIENLNRQLQRYIGRVSKWKNSDQRQRWVASALLEIQPRFKTVEGHKQLPLLRQKMMELTLNNATDVKAA